MQATPTSNSKSRKSPKNKNKKRLPMAGPWEPSKVNSKCPATIFAANRIESVPGRMTLLTLSINTIKGIKTGGVPEGTKWDINLLNWNVKDQIIMPSQRGRPRAKVILKWLDPVNTYGKRPIKLEKMIMKNILMNTEAVPGIAKAPNKAASSPFK